MNEIVIFDGEGYWCGQRRSRDGQRIHFWSTKKEDAATFHFMEVARRIASQIPQAVTFRRADRGT